MFKVSLIIPTYNEAENLSLLFEEIDGIIDKNNIDLEYIVVDDNSPDGTGEVAEKLSQIYPIKVIHRTGKLGLGSAVIAGFNFSGREYLGVMDGDLSHDPKILNELICSLDKYDIAIGSRFDDTSVIEGLVWWRKIIAYSGAFAARNLCSTRDPLSGYFFLRRPVIEKANLKCSGYKILLEILVKGEYKKVIEAPYCFRMRKSSTSKLNYKEYLLFIEQLFFYSFYRIKYRLLKYAGRK
jgi:dolichol-phosphate mannosyltransferase